MARASLKRFGKVDSVFDDSILIVPDAQNDDAKLTDLVQCYSNNFQPNLRYQLPERGNLRIYLREGDGVEYAVAENDASGDVQQAGKTASYAMLIAPRCQENGRYVGIIDQIARSRGELSEAWLPEFEGHRVMITAQSVAHLLPQTPEMASIRASSDVVPMLYALDLLVGTRITCEVDGDIGGRFIAVNVERMPGEEANNEAKFIGSVVSAGADEVDVAFLTAMGEIEVENGDQRVPSRFHTVANGKAKKNEISDDEEDDDLKADAKKKWKSEDDNASEFFNGIICTVQRNFGFIWSEKHGRVFFHREDLSGSLMNSDLYTVRMDEMFHPLQVVKYSVKKDPDPRWRDGLKVTFIEPSHGSFNWDLLRVTTGEARGFRFASAAMLGNAEFGDFIELHRNALPSYKLDIRDAVQLGEHYNVLLASKVETNPRFRGDRRVWFALTVLPDDVKNLGDLLQRIKVDIQEDQQAAVLNAHFIRVGSLRSDTCAQMLKAYFKHYGNVVHAHVIREWKTRESKLYGFIGFDDAGASSKALREGPHFIDGQQVSVSPAGPPKG